MSHVYTGDDLRPAGAGGTRTMPDGIVPAASSDLNSNEGTFRMYAPYGGHDATLRPSWVEEEVLTDIAETPTSKFCAVETCKAYHLKDGIYCTAHNRQMFDRKAHA